MNAFVSILLHLYCEKSNKYVKLKYDIGNLSQILFFWASPFKLEMLMLYVITIAQLIPKIPNMH